MKSKNLKTMLLSAVLCTVAWGGGFVNMAVLSVGADEAAATQTVATSDKIVAPAVTVPTQTYLTWEETGINREAILASAPESLGEKYENGVFSMPDWGLTGVEVMLFASSSSYDLTLTDGVWSVSLDLTAEQVAEGYHLFLDTASCSYDYHWNYMTSSYELENVHGSNYKITVGKNDKSAYGYQKGDLNVWTYYNNKTGALAYQDVENIKTKDIAYYEVDGTLYEVSVYVDHWYHYFPETGWSDGVVPTGYEGKEAAWFKTECPCQIPGVLGSGDGDNVGGGENGGNGDNVGGGENGGNGDNVDGGENGGNGDNIDGGENGGNGDNVGGGENGGKENEKDNSPTSSIEETVDSGNVSNDSSSDASGPKGLSKGARIGIIIAIIVAVSVGGFAIYWFGIRKKDFDDLLDLFKN